MGGSGFSLLGKPQFLRLLQSYEGIVVSRNMCDDIEDDSLRSFLYSSLQVSYQTYSVPNHTHASFTLFSSNLVKILNFLGNTFQSVQLLKHKLEATAPWSPGVCSYCPCGSIPFLDSHAPLSSGHPHKSGCLGSLGLHHW